MLKIEKRLIYNAFGLNIISDIYLPELDSMTNMTDEVDVEIIVKEISCNKQELENNPFQHFVIKDEVMFNVPNIANFYIKRWKKDHHFSFR